MPHYAVRAGRAPGIYATWAECSEQVNGFPGAVFKKFDSRADAEAFAGLSAVPAAPVAEANRAVVYTDGSFNRGRGGFAVVRFRPDGKTAVFYGPCIPHPSTGVATNNRAELTAIIRAIEAITDPLPLHIRTDSQYSIGVCTSWMQSWKRRYGPDAYNWRSSKGDPVENPDLLFRLSHLIDAHPFGVTFEHVYGHKGTEGNELADVWADKGRTMDRDDCVVL